MAVAFACPGCSTPFRVTEDMAGKRAKCPKCLMVFTLPGSEALGGTQTRGPAETPEAPADSFKDSERYSPEPRRRRERDDDGDRDRDRDRDRDEARPKRAKARRSGGSALPWVLGLGGAALVLFLLCGGSIAIVAMVGLSGGNNNPAPGQGIVAVNNNPPVVIQPPVMQPPVLQPPPVIKPPGFNPPPFPKPPVFGAPGGQVVQLKAGPGQRIQLFNGQFVTTSSLGANDPFDPEDKKFRCKLYQVDLQAGRNYVIDMTSPNAAALDPYLRIEDMNEVVLARDDDGGGFPNARIFFTPAITASYVIVATSYAPHNAGQFTLSIRENK